ncbi:MAG: helix-turn-helix transcriptional regulator, partial [Nitrososphaera sp.]|nr:helix-turn-helix transcriptional regulator [Nitrososphaera sp.]
MRLGERPHLGQKALSRKLDFGEDYVHEIESGKRQINESFVEKLFKEMDWDRREFDRLWAAHHPERASKIDSYRKLIEHNEEEVPIGIGRRAGLKYIEDLADDYRTIFGGRDKEISELDSFLQQEQHSRALLIAPTGRGKTALLVNWIDKVRQDDGWHVVFHPISNRFNTASART